MNRVRSLTMFALMMVSVVSLDACRRKPTMQPSPTTTGPDTMAERLTREEMERRRRDSIARADQAERERRRADSLARARGAVDEGPVDLRAVLTAVVNFDFDQSDLRPDSRAALDAKVPILQANPNVMLRIAGHTDERGSDEYNLALGQRRAATAKRYLVDRGIAETRLETISYGEERPVAQGSDESAWAKNRRAEFMIIAGATNLKKP